MAESVETLVVDLRTQTKQLGAKETARRVMSNVRFSLEDLSEKDVEDWPNSCESAEETSGECCAHGKAKIEEAVGGSSRKKNSVSLSLFLEVNDLEVEEEVSTLATQAWREGVWIGKWPAEKKEAWRKADL